MDNNRLWNFLEELDISIYRAVLERFVRSGDTILLERRSDQPVDPQNCRELCDLKLPPGISIRGWDDPKMRSLAERYDSVCELLQTIYPIIVNDGGKLQYRFCPRAEYQQARQDLDAVDFEELCPNEDLKGKLPDSCLPPREYIPRLDNVMQRVAHHFGELINTSFVDRGASLAKETDNSQGTTWVLGGGKHFYFYPDHPSDADHSQAIENLHATLQQRKMPAVIFRPVSLTEVDKVKEQPLFERAARVVQVWSSRYNAF